FFVDVSSYRLLVGRVVLQLGQGIGARGRHQQPCLHVGKQLIARVGDIQVTQRQLTNTISRRERGRPAFHRKAVGMVGQVGRLGVQNGIVITAAQLKRDLARNGS